MPSYKKSECYQEYLRGDTVDGRSVRPGHLPAYQLNEGTITVAAGEVWCRFVDENGEMCLKNTRFSSESNLKAHLKKHRFEGRSVTVKRRKVGANSFSENLEALGFYRTLSQAKASGEAGPL